MRVTILSLVYNPIIESSEFFSWTLTRIAVRLEGSELSGSVLVELATVESRMLIRTRKGSPIYTFSLSGRLVRCSVVVLSYSHRGRCRRRRPLPQYFSWTSEGNALLLGLGRCKNDFFFCTVRFEYLVFLELNSFGSLLIAANPRGIIRWK